MPDHKPDKVNGFTWRVDVNPVISSAKSYKTYLDKTIVEYVSVGLKDALNALKELSFSNGDSTAPIEEIADSIFDLPLSHNEETMRRTVDVFLATLNEKHILKFAELLSIIDKRKSTFKNKVDNVYNCIMESFLEHTRRVITQKTPEDHFYQTIRNEDKNICMEEDMKRTRQRIVCRGIYFSKLISTLMIRNVVSYSQVFWIFLRIYNNKSYFARIYFVHMMDVVGLVLHSRMKVEQELQKSCMMPMIDDLFNELDKIASESSKIPKKLKRTAKRIVDVVSLQEGMSPINRTKLGVRKVLEWSRQIQRTKKLRSASLCHPSENAENRNQKISESEEDDEKCFIVFRSSDEEASHL